MPENRSARTAVLLAEDDGGIRFLLKTLLEQAGYAVIEAANGEEAVKAYIGNRDVIQLVLLDVMMPKKTSKEVCEEIGKINPDVKTILMSGYPKEVLQGRGLLEEGVAFLSKPVDPQELLKKMSELLS
ncbi:MAG: response regulator [Nitrospirota bacterium]